MVVVVAAAEAMTLKAPVDFGMLEAVARTAVTKRVSLPMFDAQRSQIHLPAQKELAYEMTLEAASGLPQAWLEQSRTP